MGGRVHDDGEDVVDAEAGKHGAADIQNKIYLSLFIV